MRLRSALPWIVASALLAGCGSRAVPTADSDPDLEQQNGEEREALLNADPDPVDPTSACRGEAEREAVYRSRGRLVLRP